MQCSLSVGRGHTGVSLSAHFLECSHGPHLMIGYAIGDGYSKDSCFALDHSVKPVSIQILCVYTHRNLKFRLLWKQIGVIFGRCD